MGPFQESIDSLDLEYVTPDQLEGSPIAHHTHNIVTTLNYVVYSHGDKKGLFELEIKLEMS